MNPTQGATWGSVIRIVLAAWVLAWITNPAEARGQEAPLNVEGVWVADAEPLVKGGNEPITFRYDCETVTLFLASFGTIGDEPKDGVYRLKSLWRGNDLYCLFPYGGWQYLATHDDGRFVSKEGGGIWPMHQSTHQDLDWPVLDLLKEREPWHYNILRRSFEPMDFSLVRGPHLHVTRSIPVKPLITRAEEMENVFAGKEVPGYLDLVASQDGSRFATFSEIWDIPSQKHLGHVTIWNGHTNQAEIQLKGLPAWIRSAAFSPDGRAIALGDQAGAVRVWDVVGNRELLCVHLGDWPVFEIVYGRNGLLAAGARDGGIVILDAKSGVSLQTIARPEGSFLCPLAFSADGKRLFMARDEEGIIIYNLESGQDEQTLADLSSFGAWAIDRQHRRIAVVKAGTPSVWDLETGECLVQINSAQGHQGGIECIAFSPDERYLATVGGMFDGTVKLWDVATGQLIFTLGRAHEWRRWSVNSLIFLSDGQHLLTSGPASRMDVWDVSELIAGAFPVPEEPRQAERLDERKPRIANESAPIRPDTRLAVVLFAFLGAGLTSALVWMVGRLLPR